MPWLICKKYGILVGDPDYGGAVAAPADDGGAATPGGGGCAAALDRGGPAPGGGGDSKATDGGSASDPDHDDTTKRGDDMGRLVANFLCLVLCIGTLSLPLNTTLQQCRFLQEEGCLLHIIILCFLYMSWRVWNNLPTLQLGLFDGHFRKYLTMSGVDFCFQLGNFLVHFQ
jgi:hypothetical protein